MLLQIVYFLLVGWWFGGIAALVGYLLCASVIGLPIGVLVLNRLPTLIYLKEPGEACPDGYPHRHVNEEMPFLLRVIWFFLLGWELGLIFVAVGYVLLVTVIGIPLGVWVLNRVPLILTLSRRYD